MTISAVSQCPQCGAVINIHWLSCLVCHVALNSSFDLPPAPQTLVTNESISAQPLPPIMPGWLVTYRDQAGKLSGGADDRAHGTVQECRWEAGWWTVYLSDGQRVSLSCIRAVGKTNQQGQVLGVWTTREHGYDGDGPSNSKTGAEL